MKTTAILNLKGGVAKTTTAINLAAVMQKYSGKRVLLIDADSQCNLTEFCGINPDGLCASLVDVMQAPATAAPNWVIQKSSIDGVDILPATDDLMGLDISAIRGGKVNGEAIRIFLYRVKETYDFCFIDCPPAFNASGFAALVAADNVLIPIKLDAFSLRGMGNLMKQVRNMQAINPGLEVAGLLPTMFYRSERTKEAMRVLTESRFRIFPTIRQSRKVDEMTYQQKPLCICSPQSAAAVDYRRFAVMFLEVAK